MGICLDTEQKNEELETTGGDHSRGESAWAGRATPSVAAFPMQNSSHVKFEPPNVPVIFVLGGPGSGKVTHCDNLMQERRGVVHINMTDLLQQYAIGNGTANPDMQDFGTLSSKTVTEVLMLEMKMAPTAKTYLVSGYPRSMRDVAEYSDKVR
uniref:Adenylate kinase n=1 Tax=Heliothis virescens TaxID=7102 RepID=A0A2A4JEZ0_HELVI